MSSNGMLLSSIDSRIRPLKRRSLYRRGVDRQSTASQQFSPIAEGPEKPRKRRVFRANPRLLAG
jgi:hypothetical protein